MSYADDPLFYPPNAPVASPTPSDVSAAASAQSAIQSASSATASQTAANAASSSASAAATSATQAADSAGHVTEAVTAAATSASQANTSRIAAQTAQTASETASTAAQASASTAATQADISTDKAVVATTQAGISTTQAGISTTQAGIATAKALEALNTANSIGTALTTTTRINPFYDAIAGYTTNFRAAGYVLSSSTATITSNLTLTSNVPIAIDGYLDSIDLYAQATGTIKIKRFTKVGTAFTQVGPDYTYTVSATGLTTVLIAVPVKAGEYVSVWSAGGIFRFASTATSPIYSTAGDVSSFTGSGTSNIYLEVRLNQSYPAVTNARVTAIEATITALQYQMIANSAAIAQISTPFALMRDTTFALNAGTAGFAANTWVARNRAVVTAGWVNSVRLWALTAGTVRVKRYTRNVSTYTFIESRTVTVVPGLNTVALSSPMYMAVGDLPGFYAAAGVLAYENGSASPDDLVQSTGDVETFTSTTAISTLAELGFDMVGVKLTDARMTAVETTVAANSAAIPPIAIRAGNSENLNSTVRRIGYDGPPVAGTLGSGPLTFIFRDARMVKSGYWEFFLVNGVAGKTIVFKRAIRTGSSLEFKTVGAEVSYTFPVTGTQLVPVGLQLNIDDYPAVTFTATGGFYATSTADPRGFWSTGTLPTTNPITYGVSTNFSLNFTMLVREYQTNVLSVFTSDKCAVSGDSYTQGDFTPKGKNVVGALGERMEWRFENMAIGGQTYATQLATLRANTPTYGNFGPKDFGATHVLCLAGRNDTYGGRTPEQIKDDIRQTLETWQGLGCTTILSTPWNTQYGGVGFQTFIKGIADEKGAHFIDMYPYTRNFYSGTVNINLVEAAEGHQATRAKELMVNPLVPALEKILGRPNQSLKIFRARETWTASTIQDYMFHTLYERGQRWQEIMTGHYAITDATEKYLDQMQSTVSEKILSEYLMLQANVPVTFTNYMLVDAILPYEPKNVAMVTICLSDPTLNVYVRDLLGTPYQAAGLPTGVWKLLYNDGSGRWNMSRDSIKSCMNIDKLSIMVEKPGGGTFTLSDIHLESVGIPGKYQPAIPNRGVERRPQGPELLTTPFIGAIGGTATTWTAIGSPVVTTSASTPAAGANMLPRGCTAFITVDDTNKIKQTFTYIQSSVEDQEAEIVIWPRYFPALVDPTTYPVGAGITGKTFDRNLLKVELQTPSGSVPFSFVKDVGTWFDRIVLRTVLPMDTNTMTITLGTVSGKMDAYWASIKAVN